MKFIDRLRYSKRKRTLLKKVYELCTLCDVDVYLVAVHHGDETVIINTRNRGDWPPAEEQLEDMYLMMERFNLDDLGEYLAEAEPNVELELPEPPELL
ncbi:hypothetical protein BGW36DRAFT_431153 [Talaromyces proteolyticus]|uniref:MADS-box domain-containing protein n=1 Tax=Talaromyces proteolyticus TaxID=1131652 RepID=A0AAD4KLD6_9EURO|nr:uncharacterized protein BGW36DRAFT_431153 [Talaromyces proteolyticus]KAH8691911.1 hypothetical protein BGW36DRAFT_431153 [Talaromyces proteolyticus]